MKSAVLNQRKERDRLLAEPYLTRQTVYDFDALLRSPNIKLLTGPRRVGKSTQAILMLRGKNFAYLNFDDNGKVDYIAEYEAGRPTGTWKYFSKDGNLVSEQKMK